MNSRLSSLILLLLIPDSDYSGRVKQMITNYHSTLTISDVRERDSGQYQLMFIMKDGVKHLSSAAVNLTVTVLQVKRNPESIDMTDKRIKLTCASSCTSGVSYNWMKNGKDFDTGSRVSISTNDDKYSCFINPDREHSSSYLCVSPSGCWDVTYSSRRVCALVGSTVDISCSYSHPSSDTVNKTFWHYGRPDVKDLREEHQFAGRVEYVGNKLRIKELKSIDSGEYRFRFITNSDEYSGSPGVTLTVTDTQVTRSPSTVSGGEKVILNCLTKCTLNNKHTYIWYKNGRQVTDGFTKVNKLYLDSVSDEELQQYSCAVGDQEESTALRNTAVILCVFLTLALIGILWYRRRICNLSKTHMIEKGEEGVQCDSVHNNTAPSDFTQKADADNQDILYSSVSFEKKPASSVPYLGDDTEAEAVHYATVRFK
ncbi:muscle M-line assembly protein unc-89-like isoform X2 [Carassius gibelio]|uniref:muscle M-line assembly protein unc-89-like isoform X2 n=1 Tax=Carassius gibelio TaxID=101364 RepID=UPI002277F98D|nr:muscle M-line assembly protein unc-89-like isoform X2 [Carassius gibelio]